MVSEDHLRATLLHYLSRSLPNYEREEFEEQLIGDPEFFDAAVAQEQDLIDAYVLGRLDPEESGIVRSWVDLSPDRMLRVSMARTFLVKRQQNLRRKRLMAVLAVAACTLIAIGTLFGTLSRARQQNTVSRKMISGPRSESKGVRSGAAPVRSTVILLIAERVRGDQNPSTYHVDASAPVELQVLLTGATVSNSGYSLQVESIRVAHRILLEKQDLRPESVQEKRYLKALFAPGSFPAGTYKVVVRGGGDELVAQFTVHP